MTSFVNGKRFYNADIRGEYLILSIIFVLAVIVRIYISTIFFGTSAEGYANIFLTRNVFESGFISYPDRYMLLFYFLSASLLFIINDAFWATMIVTTLFGAGSLLIIYLLAKKIFDRRIASLLLLLLFLHPEFTIISSMPLKEPVYTFFVFLGILFLINNQFMNGATAVGLSFLTRMEALWINMPAYIVSTLTIKKYRPLICIAAIFILTVLFMNIIANEPYEYITINIGAQNELHPLHFLQLKELPKMIFLCVGTLLKYLFKFSGFNIFFIGVGMYTLINSAKKDLKKRIFLIFLSFNSMFWIMYIFLYGSLLGIGNDRYIHILLPFMISLLIFGFFAIYDKISGSQRYLLSSLFIISSLFTFPIYFITQGRYYYEMSKSNQALTEISEWIKSNIEPTPENKILIDGIPFFYMFRSHNDYNLIKIEEVKEKIAGGPDNLLSFIEKEKIEFVIWNEMDWACRRFLPYLKKSIVWEGTEGSLIPIETENREAVIYKYVKKVD